MKKYHVGPLDFKKGYNYITNKAQTATRAFNEWKHKFNIPDKEVKVIGSEIYYKKMQIVIIPIKGGENEN